MNFQTYHFAGLDIEFEKCEQGKVRVCSINVGSAVLQLDQQYSLAVTCYCHDNDLGKFIETYCESSVELQRIENVRDVIVNHVRTTKVVS